MKLLICTQKVDKNDSVLGFFHSWIEEFAKHCEKLTVICLEKGEYHLPYNVKVFSLSNGSHISHIINHISILKKITYVVEFYSYIWKYHKEYEYVFIHMNPEYVVMGGWLWKALGKRINLWYVHRQVDIKLRIAAFLADKIFSVAPGSIGLKSNKISFVGHGINTEFFKCELKTREQEVFKIISVGRITRIKNLDTLIKAVDLLRKKVEKKFVVELVGEPVTNDDKKYREELEKLISSLYLEEIVKFKGPKIYADLLGIYCQSDLLVNLAPTGGLDKVVLEAMACGLPVLACNQSFEQFFGNYRGQVLFQYNNSEDLVDKILYLMSYPDPKLNAYLRQQVVEPHNLVKLVEKLCINYGKNKMFSAYFDP